VPQAHTYSIDWPQFLVKKKFPAVAVQMERDQRVGGLPLPLAVRKHQWGSTYVEYLGTRGHRRHLHRIVLGCAEGVQTAFEQDEALRTLFTK
jgi:hypothetical protein